MLNIVVPMAGRGSRFALAGFEDPKPLIPIHGIPMIRWVIKNLMPALTHKFIFICQAEHVNKYHLTEKLEEWAPGSVVISVAGITSGAAATVLLAKQFIDNDYPLVIANSDQWVDENIQDFYESMKTADIDGLIMTMKANDPKWSYIAKDEFGYINRVAEKEVISDDATVGIYAFTRGADFVEAANRMIEKGETVNGEFYVAPAYNVLIAEGAKILNFDVGAESQGMYGLGIPEDLEAFQATELSKTLRVQLWK